MIKRKNRITKENARSVRPGYGMHPKHLESILGKTFNQDIDNGERLSINMILK